MDNSKKKDYDAINDYQIAHVWGATAPAFGGKSAKLATSLTIAQIRTEKGYRSAIVLPWAAVHSGERPPATGSLLGFDVHLNDRDEGAFQGKRAWFAQSNMTWMDASLFGTVELVAESNVETRTPQ